MLKAGGLAAAEIDLLDLDKPLEMWPDYDACLERLVTNYSSVLDVEVEGEVEEDFLLWNAIDVRDTYANDSLRPDAEHLCLAMLILEGAIPVAASGNWDGLIEEALRRLAGDPAHVLRVLVSEDEFRLPEARCDLIKFHGCAVKAKADPEKYRKLLVAQKSQVAAWVQNPDRAVALNRLTDIVATRPTLMVGLSAQDADIHELFSQAQAKLAWAWPSEPTPIVFAEEEIGSDQRLLLKIVYGDYYQPNRHDIAASARLGSYAKPLLFGLVLFTLAAKLSALIASLSGSGLDETALVDLQGGVLRIRDAVADAESDDLADFVTRVIESVSLALAVFRRGEPPNATTGRYEALSAQRMELTEVDPNVPVGALRNLAIAASLLGKGHADGNWVLRPGVAADLRSGVCQVDSDQIGTSKVFIVQDSEALVGLESRGYLDIDDSDVLVIHASPTPVRQRRSPAARYGRSGSSAAREVVVATFLGPALDAQDLFERFRREAGI